MRLPPLIGRRRDGFTVIEMLVVMAMLSLFASAAIMAWPASRTDETIVKTTADTLARQLAKLRSRAITENRGYGMSIGSAPDQGAVADVDGVELYLLQGAERRQSGTVGFAADGSSAGGRLLVVRGTQSRIVEVSWPLGRIAVLRTGA